MPTTSSAKYSKSNTFTYSLSGYVDHAVGVHIPED